jgi:hypothetical protein
MLLHLLEVWFPIFPQCYYLSEGDYSFLRSGFNFPF